MKNLVQKIKDAFHKLVASKDRIAILVAQGICFGAAWALSDRLVRYILAALLD